VDPAGRVVYWSGGSQRVLAERAACSSSARRRSNSAATASFASCELIGRASSTRRSRPASFSRHSCRPLASRKWRGAFGLPGTTAKVASGSHNAIRARPGGALRVRPASSRPPSVHLGCELVPQRVQVMIPESFTVTL
jgi:hypothetical protein